MNSVCVGELKNRSTREFCAGRTRPLLAEPSVGQRRICHYPRARIAFGSSRGDICRSVGGGVVDYDELEIRIGRRQNRPNAARDVVRFIPGGNYYRHERRAGRNRVGLVV
jgi:hypothetical protein